jgi:hypothetical protein
MVSWQTAARIAAYLVVLLLGIHWVWSAALHFEQPPLGTEAVPAYDAIVVLARLAGFGSQAAFGLVALTTGVKLVLGAYLTFTAAIAAYRQALHGKADDFRRDVGLLVAVIAIMALAAPLLTAGYVMPGIVDDLTLAILGIVLAAIGNPDFAREPASVPAAQT